MVVLAGQPHDDASWSSSVEEAASVMVSARLQGREQNLFDDGHLSHRRGEFAALAHGVSFGGGQKVRAGC